MGTYVSDHRYSALHQERLYLLSALAAEESRAEQMTRSLQTTRAKLMNAADCEDSTDAVANLRKAASAIVRKLKKCQKNQRAMANNLDAVTSRMQMLEEHQWRRAQFEYSQKMLQTPMYGMAMGLQEMSLDTLISPAYGYPCTPYPATSHYSVSSPTISVPSILASPMLQSLATPSTGAFWGHALPAPYHDQFYSHPTLNVPSNTPQSSVPSQELISDNRPVMFAPDQEPMRRARRMSLPNPTRKNSWHLGETLTEIGEESVVNEGMDLGRRLSMVDGTSSALRMQRKLR
jgi:hypothetical protein